MIIGMPMQFRLPFQRHECSGSCAGTSAGLGAHLLWGFAVLFWPLLTGMDPVSIMSHRMLWTAVFLAAVLAFTGQLNCVREVFRDRKLLLPLATAAFLLAFNWTIYIWGVTSGRVVESTLGYFITPLLNVLMGRLFLGETLSKAQSVSIGLAFCAVAVSIIAFGHVPWLGLVLATSFAFYGFVQKTLRMPAAASLFIQALILMPVAILWLLIMEEGMGMTGHGALRPVLLLCTVFFTGLPLMMFGYAARRVTLATIGILQYVSPSIAFLLAITVLGEGIKTADMISFPVIWLALAIYTWDALHHLHRTKEKA